MDMNNIEKKSFKIDSFELECKKSIPVELGYETYGTLNENKDNVVLIAHYFSASSHAAGKYSPDDAAPGYWDGLIGPGKAIDTDKYFVISIDNLANVQEYNPKVITTGPRSINPATNKRWGLDFPPYTFKDVAKIQHKFITEQLGINKIHMVAGASAGGFIALEWAINFNDMVEKCMGVITNAQNPTITSFSVLQHAMRAIKLDPAWKNGNYEDGEQPVEGLSLAIQMMNAGAFSPEFYEKTYTRDSFEEEPYLDINTPTSYEKQLDDAIKVGLPLMDASHWYYSCRATLMHDVAHGYDSLEDALARINADVLMVSCTKDLLQPTVFNEILVDKLNKLNKSATLYKITSDKGHMAGVLDTHLFEDEVRKFIK